MPGSRAEVMPARLQAVRKPLRSRVDEDVIAGVLMRRKMLSETIAYPENRTCNLLLSSMGLACMGSEERFYIAIKEDLLLTDSVSNHLCIAA
jgi:hypothetical protein